MMKSYRFSNDLVESITVDSTQNYEEYKNSLDERLGGFYFYIKDQHDIDNNELTKNIKKYLTEYMSLPAADRRTYRTYASLQGTYVSKNSTYYRKLIFRGKKTATMFAKGTFTKK